jgi:hypothetical protein
MAYPLASILAWRIYWLTMSQRSSAKVNPDLVFTPLEQKVLRKLKPDKGPKKKKT